jgi:hypothetical protein
MNARYLYIVLIICVKLLFISSSSTASIQLLDSQFIDQNKLEKNNIKRLIDFTSSDLPIIVINTNGQTINSTNKRKRKCSLQLQNVSLKVGLVLKYILLLKCQDLFVLLGSGVFNKYCF